MKRFLRSVLIAAPLCMAVQPAAFAAQQPAGGPATAPARPPGVERLDPALDALIAPDAQIERVATGFKFVEGALWRRSGVLWFSDLVGNVVYQLAPDGKVAEVLNPGGYDGNSLPDGGYNGPNGMANGPRNTVTLAQHGNRRIVSVDANRKVTVLADRYEGMRLNSPNDLMYAPDGSLYFTDPPYGLPKREADPEKELKFNGVFRLAKGKLQLLIQDIPSPNGIAFSPDYKTLYVTNAASGKRMWMAYDVGRDGGVSNGRIFADASASTEGGTTDGMEVDSKGNLWATGPGGLWIISPTGKHLGTLRLPEPPTSAAFGDDGKSLYVAARNSIYRIRVKVAGLKPVYY